MIKPGEQIYIIDQESEKEDKDKKTENEEENRNGDDTENTEDTSGMQLVVSDIFAYGKTKNRRSNCSRG